MEFPALAEREQRAPRGVGVAGFHRPRSAAGAGVAGLGAASCQGHDSVHREERSPLPATARECFSARHNSTR